MFVCLLVTNVARNTLVHFIFPWFFFVLDWQTVVVVVVVAVVVDSCRNITKIDGVQREDDERKRSCRCNGFVLFCCFDYW